MTAVVYWLRYSEHSDPYNEGYIGISGEFNTRKARHEKGRSGAHIHNRINSGASFVILHECDDVEEALALETRYRPIENIGWNLAAGGGLPPSQKGKSYDRQKLTGDDRTEAQKIASIKHSKTMSGRVSSRKGVVLSESTKDKMGKRVIIDGIEYATYSKAAAAIGVSVSTISIWSKKNIKDIVTKAGNTHKIEFRTGA